MENEVKTFHVEKMACAHCAARVEKAIAALGAEAKVDLQDKKVVVTGQVSDAEVIKAVTLMGYPISRE